MESNWIEIKRFLKDYKKSIIIGALIFSFLFAIGLFFINSRSEETSQNEEDFEPSPSEILNDAQPAFFQLYIEYEDGKPYTNYSIVNQYFNLSSVKEEASEATGVDIEAVEEHIEEEVYLNDLDENIRVINVSRNDSNHLFTLSFNSGNERNNLAIAEYYFDLIFEGDSDFFSNKSTYLFVEPTMAKPIEDEEETDELAEANAQSNVSIFSSIIEHAINIITGLILGTVLMIGLALLKELFGKKLNYSFAYDIAEDEKFILYDKNLKNRENISQFVAAPFGEHKIIVSEKNIEKSEKDLFVGNGDVSFESESNPGIILTEEPSLSNIKVGTKFSEIIILVHPTFTTRKWYKVQKDFASIYDVSTKVIQVNK